MINVPLLLAFIGAASVLTITPGLDTAIVLRALTASGRRSALHAAAGIASGCLIWGAAVSLGLGALLQASEAAYTIVKIAGAAYLLWIAVTLLCKPRSTIDALNEPTAPSSGEPMFWRGFLTNLLNPKVGIFYITFLPQFVPGDANPAVYCFFLACLHVLLTAMWFGVLIALTAPLVRFLRRPSSVKTLDRLTAGIFIVFGIRLAMSSRS